MQKPKLHLGGIARFSWQTFLKRWRATMVVTAVFLLTVGISLAPYALAWSFGAPTWITGLLYALYIVGILIATSPLMAGVIAIARGESLTSDLFKDAFKKSASMIGLIIIMFLGVSLGLLLFVVPGVLLAMRWYCAPYILIGENKTILESLRESNERCKGYSLDLFAFSLVLSILGVLAIFPVLFMFTYVWSLLLIVGIIDITPVVVTVLLGVMYLVLFLWVWFIGALSAIAKTKVYIELS